MPRTGTAITSSRATNGALPVASSAPLWPLATASSVSSALPTPAYPRVRGLCGGVPGSPVGNSMRTVMASAPSGIQLAKAGAVDEEQIRDAGRLAGDPGAAEALIGTVLDGGRT
ncbi:hypothetical protein [Streptomyces sp. NPDC059649]|uniref:hypothetical protein n=1 Tax=Streptomyces sp. NPDC059649 TaxID=3346895 RepID=UPI0036AD1942